MKPFHWILLGGSLPILVIVAWGLLDTACAPNALKASGETFLMCSRSWVAALSGWVAAAAAIATIRILLRQLRQSERIANRKQFEAAKVFDSRLLEMLHDLNDLWKRVEDVREEYFAGEKDIDPHSVVAIQNRFSELNSTLEYSEHSLSDLLSQMNAIEANKRSQLIHRLRIAFSPLYEESSQDIEVMGPDYIERKIFNLALFKSYTEEYFHETSKIFSNRSANFPRPDMRETYRRWILAGLPDNPDNPY